MAVSPPCCRTWGSVQAKAMRSASPWLACRCNGWMPSARVSGIQTNTLAQAELAGAYLQLSKKDASGVERQVMSAVSLNPHNAYLVYHAGRLLLEVNAVERARQVLVQLRKTRTAQFLRDRLVFELEQAIITHNDSATR